ncbi:hypothetical protein EDC04DRAFT_2581765, partial [Pisolithus marmoratus]
GTPCDVDGNYLPPKTPPPPLPQPVNPQDAQPWHPFTSQGHFELADFLFCREQMSGGNINDLMHIWAALDEKGKPPFNSHSHLYQTIDDISQENSWDCLEMHHVEANNPNAAPWKQSTYQICLHDAGKLVEQQLSNPGLKEFIDYSPQLVFGENHQRAWSNFMTGNWAWNQCNELAKKEENHGAMFVPIILGSDKTVVSVATGNNEYWPLYITTGNVHNSAHCGHGQAVSLLGFLSVPKSRWQFKFYTFRWFQTIGDKPCQNTGMWMVKPSFDDNGDCVVSVITLDNILRPAHLIGIYGPEPLPRNFTHTDSLTAFSAFYVNRFSGYHAYQLCF